MTIHHRNRIFFFNAEVPTGLGGGCHQQQGDLENTGGFHSYGTIAGFQGKKRLKMEEKTGCTPHFRKDPNIENRP